MRSVTKSMYFLNTKRNIWAGNVGFSSQLNRQLKDSVLRRELFRKIKIPIFLEKPPL